MYYLYSLYYFNLGIVGIIVGWVISKFWLIILVKDLEFFMEGSILDFCVVDEWDMLDEIVNFDFFLCCGLFI